MITVSISGINWLQIYMIFTYFKISDTHVGMHETNPVVTHRRVDFQSMEVIGDVARHPLVKVHGMY